MFRLWTVASRVGRPSLVQNFNNDGKNFWTKNCDYRVFRKLSVTASQNCVKIENVEKSDQDTVKITFSDKEVCRFKNIWLRDSCQCANCLHPQTQQKLLDVPSLDLMVKPLSLDTATDRTQLKINWGQSSQNGVHSSLYSAKWLHQFAPIFGSESTPVDRRIQDNIYSYNLPEMSTWNQKTSEKFLPISYNDFMTKESSLFSALSSVYKYGIILIKDVPTKQGQMIELVNRMSFVKETGYGKTFQVINNPDPDTHLSYTGKRFELHTDLAYMISAPGVQLLHCLVAPRKDALARTGGESFYADGFYAAEWLREQRADYFECLTKNKIPFSFQDALRKRWFHVERPIISLDSSNRIEEIYYSGFSMRPPLLPLDKIQIFYEAYNCYSSKLYDIASQWRFYLEPGDLLIFNNKRVVHGRDEYDASTEKRHLEGCYMDLEEVVSLYEHMVTKDQSSS